ncbi:MAG TPA: tetratricopeptide repeat protein [Xanthobacteraceae bacterium]|jgi:TPR repeat protein|nr:tetratricopeptide repeat protein [Xanthobacteraceae bacterium]
MDKAVKFLAAALTLWLSAGAVATSAELSDGQSIHRRSERVFATRTVRALDWRARAKADALLGFKYEHGLGVPQSYEPAVDLYISAAEQGDPMGQYLLGLMYDKGQGVQQDGIRAYMWLNLAAAHAPRRYREYYLKMRDAVASKMTPGQIVTGQRLATAWVPKRVSVEVAPVVPVLPPRW